MLSKSNLYKNISFLFFCIVSLCAFTCTKHRYVEIPVQETYKDKNPLPANINVININSTNQQMMNQHGMKSTCSRPINAMHYDYDYTFPMDPFTDFIKRNHHNDYQYYYDFLNMPPYTTHKPTRSSKSSSADQNDYQYYYQNDYKYDNNYKSNFYTEEEEKKKKLADSYKLLGVGPDDSKKMITQAHRKKAFETHPDKNPECPDSTNRCQEVNVAYKTIMEHLEK